MRKKYIPTPPLKLGYWVRTLGTFEKLPREHPVIQLLDKAGMGPDLRLDVLSYKEAVHGI